MDALSGAPVHYSTMEADELDEVSPDELDGEDDEYTEEEVDPADEVPRSLCKQFIRPRFDRWLSQSSPAQEEADLLREIFSRLNVTSRDVETVSSERRLRLEFELYGMIGCYSQTSQADASSTTWDVSQGGFDVKPNVESELVFDSETLISCSHFAGDAAKADESRSRRHVNKDRLCERFGTETVHKFGGAAVLMQFFGVICADPEASCYAEVLPFGLAASVLEVSEGAEEVRPRVLKKKAPSGDGYPSSLSAKSSPAKPPQAPASSPASTSAPPKSPRSGQPAKPTGSRPAASRPVPKGSAAAPKARQSSQGRKPASSAK